MSDHLISTTYEPPQDQGLDILYIDDHLIALNKPSGLLSVPGRGPDKSDCLLTRAQRSYPTALAVHRLDMGTSGILILARSKDVHRQLGKLFEQRLVEKHYTAMVDGRPEDCSGKIDAPLISDWPNRPRQKIDWKNGKKAVTHYRLLNYNRKADTSLLHLRPITGRSHQIRVHLHSIGHTILGDSLYAPSRIALKSPRLLLHAHYLALTHPVSGQAMEISCPALFPDLTDRTSSVHQDS